ncbi:hypothetical protein [Streptomyces sp. NPDC059452]|uniref:hypothetical protein n=1 Tax=Streptomyces sp. NPDC059452 TaxID=3346835 RepID=UPI0036C113F3
MGMRIADVSGRPAITCFIRENSDNSFQVDVRVVVIRCPYTVRNPDKPVRFPVARRPHTSGQEKSGRGPPCGGPGRSPAIVRWWGCVLRASHGTANVL